MKSFSLLEALESQNGQPVDGDRTGSFWDMLPFEGGSTWVGKWQGESPWERHSKGDEFLHVLKGQVEVVVITSKGKLSVVVPEGSIYVVPKNHWHKQIAKAEVIVIGATPGTTDSSDEEPWFNPGNLIK
jgi:mannose-6-phosphate isomerase-like protein (cupin superfamily)